MAPKYNRRHYKDIALELKHVFSHKSSINLYDAAFFFSLVFKRDNPNFDTDNFLSECGIKAQEAKDITVTVVYPVTFRANIDVHKPIDELRTIIRDMADEAFACSSIDSVIQQCDEFPELVE